MEIKVEILEKFMSELKASGYNEFDRHEILKSGITRYESLRKREDEGLRPFFRNRLFRRTERDNEKVMKKTNWFKQKNNKFTTVFFVPPTPDSILLKMLKKTEEQHKIDEINRIKFVETCGVKYIDYLKTSNRLSEKCEPTEKCFVCQSTNGVSDCKVSNVGYLLRCKTCKESGIEKSYHGETARNGYLRGREHWRELEKKSKNSVLFKHVMSEHKNEQDKINFEMKIVGKFVSPLNRLIDESIRIRNTKPTSLLNSKSEFYGPCIKRKVYEN